MSEPDFRDFRKTMLAAMAKIEDEVGYERHANGTSLRTATDEVRWQTKLTRIAIRMMVDAGIFDTVAEAEDEVYARASKDKGA